MKKLAAVLCLGVAAAAGVARADFNDGVVALTMGHYEEALNTLMPLAATSNHAYAQYFVGRMYADGQGVEQNFSEAEKWYRKAAEQGVAEAQYRLGGLYQSGDGVPKDLEYAYGWYRVAAHLGHAKAATALARFTQQLSAEELAEAKKLAGELIIHYGQTPPSTSRTD